MSNSFIAGGDRHLREAIRREVDEQIRAEFADELEQIRQTQMWRHGWFRDASERLIEQEIKRRVESEVKRRVNELVSSHTLY